jgi:hypothetical protein
MPGSRQSNAPTTLTPLRTVPPLPIDLEEVTEATRRALYDATVAIHFRIPPATEGWMPFYSPDQARLNVFNFAGRWFASWLSLEEATNTRLSTGAKRPLVTIVADPDAPYGIAFQAI